MEENLIMKSMFFSNTHWTQLLVPLEILMSKAFLKYIPSHIKHFEYSRWIINMKSSSHGKQRPNSLNHPSQWEKLKNIFLMGRKNNWASQISEVALRKPQEQRQFPFPPSGQLLRISNQHKRIRNGLEDDVCLYRPNAWWGGEFEWLKTLQEPQLENCRK